MKTWLDQSDVDTKKRYMLLGLMLLAGWLLGMVVLHQLLTDLPDIDTLQHYTPPLVTRIYDRNNEIISELFTERRTVLPLSDIPVNLQNAFMATEDQNFFRHWGINLKGIARALIADLRHGRVVEGGSTITQQLSKVLFFSQKKTLSRKLRELLLALQLEHNYSKEEIFQMYMNQIYFGHGAYGVEAAARTLFGKHAKELNLAECALIAGLPRSPKTYSPFTNPKNAQRRRAWVLSRMRRSGYITNREETEADLVPIHSAREQILPPVGAYFVEYLRQILEPKYGENSLYQSGYSIYTTLDLKMQRAAEEVMEKNLAQFDKDRQIILQAELKAARRSKKRESRGRCVDHYARKCRGPWSPWIRARGRFGRWSVGGILKSLNLTGLRKRSASRDRHLNPFVWTAAMDDDLTEATIVDDDKAGFYNDGSDWKLLDSATDSYSIALATAPFPPDRAWVPQNWDFKYFGAVTLRTGLALSRNLVSIRLVNHFGPTTIVDYAHRCGIQEARLHSRAIFSAGNRTGESFGIDRRLLHLCQQRHSAASLWDTPHRR